MNTPPSSTTLCVPGAAISVTLSARSTEILDFCAYEPALVLFKKLCRHYFDIDPAATADYVRFYREMWDSEPETEPSCREVGG